MPREAEPVDLPLPRVDHGAIGRLRADDAARASRLGAVLAREAASGGTENFDLRTLSNDFRRYGEADASGDATRLAQARADLAQAAQLAARALPAERLLDLRAYQQERFLDALRRWERGAEPDELVPLGGDPVGSMRANGWVEGRRILAPEVVRAVMFARRWNELTGLTSSPFAVPAEAAKAFYAFLLERPAARVVAPTYETARQRCDAIDAWRLRKVDELAAVDPAYPRDLARGVLFYRMGQPLAAVVELRRQLERHPDGPWALRARNYLRTALLRGDEPPAP